MYRNYIKSSPLFWRHYMADKCQASFGLRVAVVPPKRLRDMSSWNAELAEGRDRLLKDIDTTDYDPIMFSSRALCKITAWLMNTELLTQFSLAKQMLYREVERIKKKNRCDEKPTNRRDKPNICPKLIEKYYTSGNQGSERGYSLLGLCSPHGGEMNNPYPLRILSLGQALFIFTYTFIFFNLFKGC